MPKSSRDFDWSAELKAARKALRLSQAALARLAGVSPATVKAYESRLRRPSRDLLLAILDALRVERKLRDDILTGAGFAPIGPEIGPASHSGYLFTTEEAADYLDGLPWPAFVLDDIMQVVAANVVAQRLWGVDLTREFTGPLERNLLRFAATPRFADHIVNWDELVATGVSVFKGHHFGPESIEAPSPNFALILTQLLAGEPKYANRFLEVWEKTLGRSPKVRWNYPVVWRDNNTGRLRFLATVTTANEPAGLAFNDWVPLDAATWTALGKLMA
jgi:transcriptional regulator with XRE-family HTH domain